MIIVAFVLTYKGKWFNAFTLFWIPSTSAVINPRTSTSTLTVKMFNISYAMKSNITAYKSPSLSTALEYMSPSVFHTDFSWHATCVSGKWILAGQSVTAPVFDKWPEDITTFTKVSV